MTYKSSPLLELIIVLDKKINESRFITKLENNKSIVSSTLLIIILLFWLFVLFTFYFIAKFIEYPILMLIYKGSIKDKLVFWWHGWRVTFKMLKQPYIKKTMWVALALFLAVELGDIVTTYMSKIKHSSIFGELEGTPLFVIGTPFEVLVIVKLIAVGLITYSFMYNYYKFSAYTKFVLVYFLLVMTLVSAGFVVNNLTAFSMDTEDIKPLPKEERIEAYNDAVADMQIVAAAVPEKARFKLPFIFSAFIMAMATFILWRDFEKWIIQK